MGTENVTPLPDPALRPAGLTAELHELPGKRVIQESNMAARQFSAEHLEQKKLRRK